MKKLIALLVIITSGYNAAFGQSLSIGIIGSSTAWDGSRVSYYILPSGNMPGTPQFKATINNGTIIDQNLNPYNGSKMYVTVLWNCSVTSGSVTITETVTGTIKIFPVTVLTYNTAPGYCKEASPAYQEPQLRQLPALLTVNNCNHYCSTTSGYTYQWQQGTVLPGNTIPVSYTDIPGATDLTYQPPAMNAYKKMGYRRLMHFAATSGMMILGVYDTYSDPAIVDYHAQLEAGSISGGGIIQYGAVPTVTTVAATSGSCSGFTGYFYTWLYSNGDGNWNTLGYGEQYPANTPIQGNWALIRKVQCGNVEILSNLIQFTLKDLDAGTINGGGTVTAGSMPAVNQIPATGGVCNTANYEYTWEKSADGAPWTIIGNGETYPANAPVYGQTAIRRKVKCSTEEKYSNVIWFGILPYTSANVEDKNYVRVNTMLVPGVGEWAHADNLPTGDKIQSTTYFDGLSRPIQKVTREVSELQPGNWGDMVSFTEYDAAGRVPRSFLPYPANSKTGKYKENPLTEQQSFITATFNEPAGAPTFSQTYFDNSPLDRPVNNKSSGAGWGGNTAYTGNSYQYEFNSAADDIKIWSIDFTENAMPAVTGTYTSGKLFKNILIDDNQKKVYEYKDFSGNIILKKIQLDNTVAENSYDGWLCTYYVYDDLGQLRSIITPKAVTYLKVHGWAFSSRDVYNELCFYNYFDERGRTIIKHSAGAGEIHLVYDNRDRLVLSQDENQRNRTPRQWSFYLYDKDNRQIAAGLLDNNINKDQYKSYVDGLANDNIILTLFTGQNESVSAYNPVAGNPGLGSGATNLVINSVTYFDNYDYPGAKPFNTNYNFAATTSFYVEPTQKVNNTLAMATGSKIRVIDNLYDDNNPANDKFLVSTSYYDYKGRVLQGLTDNIKGGTDYATMQYDFAGKMLSVCEKQNFTGTGYTNFTVITKPEYNRIGQTTAILKKYHNQDYKKIVSFTYDAMGRVKIKRLSPDYNAGAGIESLQYDYNLHGSLIGINKDYALTNSSLAQWDHYFGVYMGYDNRDNKFTRARYDGNLTGIIWKGQGDNSPRKYDYVYDNAGRLVAADFTQRERPVDAAWANTAVDFSMTNVQYDENGNLLSMFQKGIIPGKDVPVFIDKLAYTYKTTGDGAWSNKLAGVIDNTTDLGQSNNGFLGDFNDENYGTGGTDYQYDANGNMVLDNNKKIRVGNGNGIIYNFMDKPQKVTIEGKIITEFIYDATGDKIGKKVTDIVTSQVTTTWYNGAFVYEETMGSIKLQYISHEEGRIRVFTPLANQPRIITGNNFDLPDGLKGVFEFFVKDQLQNVRAILSEETHVEHHNCTMENSDPNIAFYEESMFGQQGAANEVVATRITKANDAFAQNWTSNSSAKVVKLPAAAGSTGTIGPNMVLKVMAGDNISMHVDYYFSQPVNNGNNNVLGPLVNTLTSLIGQGVQTTGVIHGAGNDINTSLNNTTGPLNQFLQNTSSSQGSNPRAYLNYLFFDENFKFVPYDAITGLGSYAVPVTTPGNGQQINKPNVKVPKNGYVFIYLSNNSNINVYFDNLDVVHERGRLTEENAYYPYGLKIKSISARAFGKLDNKYGYQADFAEEDEETGWNEFDLRMYNPQIGRWNGADPLDEFASPYVGMGTNPANMIDPSGGGIFEVSDFIAHGIWAVAGAVAGAVVGGATHGWSTKSITNGAITGGAIGLGASFVNWDVVGSTISNAGQWIGSQVGSFDLGDAASQTVKLYLEFTGTSKEAQVPYQGIKKDIGTKVTNQIGQGKVYIKDENGNDVEEPFTAISGPDQNGLLPDGEYEISIRLNYTKKGPVGYQDDQGASFKFSLKPIKIDELDDITKFQRKELEIHPTISKPDVVKKDGSISYQARTHGCIGINGGPSETLRFWNIVSKYLKSHKNKMTIKVKISGNLNVTYQK